MGMMKPGSPFLYDDTGSRTVGVKSPDGAEVALPHQTSAEMLGAHPDASAAANTAAIQAALSRGGNVTISRPGTYAVSADAFTYDSTTALTLAKNVRFSIGGVLQDLGSLSAARMRGSLRWMKSRRPPNATLTGSSWTLATTATGASATKVSTYPIPSQPSVTPLLLTGTSTGAGQYVRATHTLSPGITSRKLAISIPVFIPDYTKVASITISVSYDAFASTSWNTVYTPEFSGNHVIGLSARIVQGLAGGLQYTTGTGATTETPFTSLRYQVTLATSVTGSVSFGDPVINAADTAELLVTVDDGDASFMRQLDSALPWSPFEYLVNRNVPATNFLIYSLIGTAGYLSATDVAQLLAAGHCVCPHGATSMASLADDAARRADVLANINGLLSFGVPDEMVRAMYAYPNGVFEVSAGDTSIMQILRDNRIRSARTASRRATSPNHVAPHRQYHTPIIGHYTDVGGGGETTAITKARVRDLVETGGTGVLTFHKFVVGSPTVDIEIQLSEFISLIDDIVAYRNAGALSTITAMDFANAHFLTPPSSNTP